MIYVQRYLLRREESFYEYGTLFCDNELRPLLYQRRKNELVFYFTNRMKIKTTLALNNVQNVITK